MSNDSFLSRPPSRDSCSRLRYITVSPSYLFPNLELLTDTETWKRTRCLSRSGSRPGDNGFRRHAISELPMLDVEAFEQFLEGAFGLLREGLKMVLAEA